MKSADFDYKYYKFTNIMLMNNNNNNNYTNNKLYIDIFITIKLQQTITNCNIPWIQIAFSQYERESDSME